MDRTIEVAEKVKTFLMNEVMKNDFSDEDYGKTIIYLRNWFEAEATFFNLSVDKMKSI